MGEITPADLDDRLARGERPLLLDIRHAEEFDDWHIPGSTNVDLYDELKAGSPAVGDALRDLPNGREIVTVCAVGRVSKRATAALEDLGYEARTLVGGMAGWSRVHSHAPVEADLGGTLIQVARPGKGCLSYFIVSDGEAAVFDASQYVEEYEAILEAHDAELNGVFDTHAHADHVSGGRRLAERHGVPYSLHAADAVAVDATPVEDGQTVTVGAVDIDVVHTPGHSPGGVTYDVADAALLTGDTLFHASVGRVELGVEAGLEDTDVEANAARLYESLQRILDRDTDPLVLPAHDPGSPRPPVVATLSEVAAHNADLGLDREAFIAKLAGDIPDHPPNFERVKAANVGLEAIPADELASIETGPNRCAID